MMLKERTPIGIWSDEMPPINLHNYPMQNKPEYKHQEVATTLSANPSTLYLETQEAFKEAIAGYPLGALPTVKPGAWVRVPQDKTLQEFAKEMETSPSATATGTKYDGGKPRMDLLDADWLEGVAKVLTFGANKYAAHNWRGGIAYSRLIASAYRHLGAINRGEDIDDESGLPHVYHLSCCVMFLSSMMQNKPELDDRWKQ